MVVLCWAGDNNFREVSLEQVARHPVDVAAWVLLKLFDHFEGTLGLEIDFEIRSESQKTVKGHE